MGAWGNFAARITLLPVFLVKAVVQLPGSFINEEPKRSAAPGAKASLAAASGKSTNGRELAASKALAASASGFAGTSEPLRVTFLDKPEIQLVWRRLIDMRNKSLMLLYEAFLYNFVVSVVKFLGAGVLLTALEPVFQFILSLFIGKYKLKKPEDGKTEVLYSFANSVDTEFSLPGDYAAFPFASPSTLSLKDAKVAEAKRGHLAAMAIKLAYENPLIIRDAVTRWGFTWLADQKADHGSSTVPETYWYAFYSKNAVIIAFRGTSPLNLINWQTDIDLGLSKQQGMGRVHDGFYDALFGEAANACSLCDGHAQEATVFDAALTALIQAKVQHKHVYVCGHSLGGALTSVFSLSMAFKQPAVASRIAGIYTFGQPRTGDDDYAEAFDDKYKDICKRYVHAADIVTKVPVGLGYWHHGEERFIPSFDIASEKARVLDNDDAVKEWEQREARHALWYGFLKLVWSQVPPQESVLRTLSRIALLPLPGLSDHFPGDYETLLRENVQRVIDTPMAA